MNEKHHSLRTRLTALLLALICVLGLFPTTAFAAGDTITLKEFGHSGVAYESAALGRCTLHEMTFKNGNKDTTGFCGTKGGDMGNSLQGQTWGNQRSISDPTVENKMDYYSAQEEQVQLVGQVQGNQQRNQNDPKGRGQPGHGQVFHPAHPEIGVAAEGVGHKGDHRVNARAEHAGNGHARQYQGDAGRSGTFRD